MSGADTDAASDRRSIHEPPNKQGPMTDDVKRPPPDSRVVLIAEDEEPIAEALIFVVEDAGYIPLVATNGKEALELARNRRPALVITDLMMPYLDGTQLIRAIHDDAQRNGHTAPPIILMTAAGMRRAQDSGADAVLRKPFNIDELEILIRQMLAGD